MTDRRLQVRIWSAPVALGALSALGLVLALVADGVGDVIGVLALAGPVLVVAWYVMVRRGTQ